MRSRFRVFNICSIVVVLVALLPIAALTAPALAAGDTSISGIVTDSGGTPVAGVQVSAYGASFFATATTAPDGTYTIGGLGTDSFRVYFRDFGKTFSPEWWSHQTDYASAAVLSVTTGDAVVGIDAALSRTSISGVVTDSVGTPLAGIEVSAYGANSFEQATSGADGSYTIPALGGDTYRVDFNDFSNVYSPEWWNDQVDYSAATLVGVTLGEAITNVDAALSRTTISGVVTDAFGQPLAGIQVSGYGQLSDPVTMTVADGSYTLSGLSPDTLLISFTGAGYSPEWWNDQPNYTTAAPITVGFGDAVTGIDAATLGDFDLRDRDRRFGSAGRRCPGSGVRHDLQRPGHDRCRRLVHAHRSGCRLLPHQLLRPDVRPHGVVERAGGLRDC